MTLSELNSSLITLLTRVGSNRISGPDILEATQNIVEFFATEIADIIPDWTSILTFQTDGSDAGKYCKYADTNGKKRIFETKIDDNTNHLPPTDPVITENTYWIEVSASVSAAIPEWAAGVYGPNLIIVYHDHSVDGPGLYLLLEPVRPYASTDIEAETTAGDWQRLGGAPVSSHFKGLFTTLIALETAYPTAEAGDYANVDPGSGTDVTRYIWDEDEGWVAGGGGGGGGVSSVTGSGVDNSDPANPVLALPNGLEAANVTGTAISFAVPQIYGSVGSPETGDITIVTTGLVKGMVQLVIHNDSNEPSYGSEIQIVSGAYAADVDNYILLLAVSSTLVLATITQEI